MLNQIKYSITSYGFQFGSQVGLSTDLIFRASHNECLITQWLKGCDSDSSYQIHPVKCICLQGLDRNPITYGPSITTFSDVPPNIIVVAYWLSNRCRGKLSG